jgi:hypothetical protein
VTTLCTRPCCAPELFDEQWTVRRIAEPDDGSTPASLPADPLAAQHLIDRVDHWWASQHPEVKLGILHCVQIAEELRGSEGERIPA